MGDAVVKLSIAPVIPLWLIVVLMVIAVGFRCASLVSTYRRRGGGPDRWTWIRFGAATLAILFLGLAATRVGDESRAENPPRLTATAAEDNINVFLVIDRSLGMTASDFDEQDERTLGEERLDGARNDLQVILRKYQGARFSVLSYADSSRVEWPLSPDVWSLVPFLWNFTPYGGDDAGKEAPVEADVAASSSLLRAELDKASREYPGSANLVYILGAGSGPGDWAFAIPEGQVSGGAVYGYGTKDGYVFLRPGHPDYISYDPVKVPLNEAALRTAADSLGIPYVHRAEGVIEEDSLVTTPPQAVPVDPVIPDVPHPNRIEFYWLFAAIGAGLSGIELYALARHWLRRRGGVAA